MYLSASATQPPGSDVLFRPMKNVLTGDRIILCWKLSRLLPSLYQTAKLMEVFYFPPAGYANLSLAIRQPVSFPFLTCTVEHSVI